MSTDVDGQRVKFADLLNQNDEPASASANAVGVRKSTAKRKNSSVAKAPPTKKPRTARCSKSSRATDHDGDEDAVDGQSSKAGEVGPDTTKRPLFNLREIIRSTLGLAQNHGLSHYVDSDKQFFIRVGTLCSGTDAPLHVMKLFGMLKNKKGQQVFTTVNAFGCEIEPFKQAFLLRNSKPQFLFRNAEDFAAEGAKTA